ncbi:MAG: MFS transporter [Thermodesulfobacteriota bacterium]
MTSRSRLHYSFYIIISSFVILFFNSGARFAIGVIFKPVIAEFGWSRSAISMAFFLHMIVFALSLILVGRLYDRYGPKWIIIISTFFLSGGCFLISLIHSLWQFFICYGIIAAIGLGGTSATLISVITSKWFEKNRGFAVSLALSGNCLGQFALIPLFSIFILQYSWRALYFFLGLIMLILNITLALLVIRGDPEAIGLKPFGYENAKDIEKKKGQSSLTQNLQDLDLREAMRSYSFWLFLFTMFVCGSGDFLVTTHLVALATDYNISAVTAANMLGWYGLMSLGGILIAGPASDVVENKIPIALTFVIRFFLFFLVLKYQGLLSFYIFALAFGFTSLITSPLTPTLMGRLYGSSHIGFLTGFIITIHHLAGGFWAYLGGLIFDKTGSYRLIFILSLIMAFMAIFSSILIKEKRHHRRSVSDQKEIS